MPDVFDELVASPPVPAGGGPTFPDVYPRAIAVNPLDEILAQITRAQPVVAPIATNGDGTSGLVEPGNIDLTNRPKIYNPDGTVSTELSFSIGTDKGEVLIPQVVGGKILSKEQAIQHYRDTGEHLGIFSDVPSANAAAEAIHNRDQGGDIFDQLTAEQTPVSDDPFGIKAARAYGQDLYETDPSKIPTEPQQQAADVNLTGQPRGGFEDFWKGLNVSSVPREVIESLTPAVGGLQDLKRTYDTARDIIGGKSYDEAVKEHFPETQTLVGIEQKPLRERIATGIDTVMQLIFAKEAGEGIPIEPGAGTTGAEASKEPVREELQPKGLAPDQIQKIIDVERRLKSGEITPSEYDSTVSETLGPEKAKQWPTGEEVLNPASSTAAPPPEVQTSAAPQAPRDIFDELASEQAPPPSALPEQAQNLASQFDELQGLGADIQSRIDALRTAATAAPTVAPPDVASPLPDWAKQNIDVLSAPLEASGVANQIEDLAAQQLTAKQIAARLGLPLESVNAVRINRGIPSMNVAGLGGGGGGPQLSPEFEQWLQSRHAPAPPVEAGVSPAEAPPAPVEPPAPETFEQRMARQDDANEWIQSAMQSKRPPATADEAWQKFTAYDRSRGTSVPGEDYFKSAWESFSKPKPVVEATPANIRQISDEQIKAEIADIDAKTKPLYDKLEAIPEDKIFVPRTTKYTPEYQALHDQIAAAGSGRKIDLDFELKRREQEAANQATFAKQEARVKGLPVYQRRNGWEIVKDEAHGQKYVVRDPFTGEEVYRHQNLNRARQVADESSAGEAEDARRIAQAPAPVVAPPAIAPAKNDIVTVSLGGREYPKTRITNVVETPEGTRYQVDVFGQKFVPAEQIKSIDQPTAPAPIVEATPDVQAKIDKVIRETKNRPDTAPAKMKVQKAYLLDALNTAHKAAPEEAPTSPEHDADLRALDEGVSPWNNIPGYYEMSQPDKEAAVAAAKATQQGLFGKYGVENEGDKADSNLREAITNARGRALPKITIEVPGDGTFEIVNSKEAIAQFRDAARKRFPTTTLKPDVPTVGGRTTEAAIGAVSKKAPTREDLIKILGQAASTDETRDVLHNTVASTGNELVATDGRRLIRVDYEGPKINVEGKGKKKGETKPAIFDIKSLKRDTAKEKDSIYPDWKKVVPDSSKLGSHGKYTTADTGSLMKLITQAEQVMGLRTNSVKLWMDDKGKLGITASSPDVGEFAGGDADPNTAKVLGAYDPQFLKDGLRMARQLGHEKVDLYLDKKSTDLSPLSIQAKGMEYVLMPMRIDSPAGNYAAVHPAVTDPAVLRYRTRADVFNELRGTGPGAAVNEMEARGMPTDAVQSHFDRVNAALESGQPQPSQADFEKAIKSDLEKWNPDAPKPIAEPGTELGLGGTRKPQRQTQPLTQTTAPNTTPQLAQTITAHTPGLGNTFAEIKNGLLQLVLPSARSPEHLRAAETLGAKLGAMHRRAEIASAALTPHERMFDRLGVDREGLAPADNVGAQFASAMSTGEPVPKGTSHAADMLKQQFDSRLKALRDAGAPLQAVRENYFPGMWTRESRLAFNAGLEEAMQAGVIPREGFNVNDATPDQRAWVKARVDDHLAKGEGSEKDMLPYLSRNPLRGKETFRKPKVFDDIMDAQEFGLRPASNNPIRLGKVKLAEMDRSIMAHQYFSDLKNKGLLKITSPYEKAPEGWTRINDPYGTIYGPPTVQLHEFVDQAVYQGLHDLAEKLGISHERGYGIGGTRLGYSVVGGNRIVTRYATETSVLAHELGHQLDERYGLWDRLEVPTKYGAGKTDVEKDLRAIADLTGRGKYARKKVEKMAQVIEAYVHAPEKMKEVAPTVFERFDNFVRSTPEVKPLADIAPGIKLQKLTSEKYVGLPIMGYRVVPEAHGDILNNYLSSSLYNNKYLGALYKGWMGGAGALNQAQLGVGSAFHVGFTSADVQVSAGAKMLKDIYGVLRGNRSIPDAIQSAAKTATAIVHTPILGDKVLNEWRNPQAPLDSKIVAVTRAAELAGGGFHMERGLRTEQADKVRSDWYSGHKLRAALRSPVAATELMAKPIMEYLVPRQKAGVFAELASRIIEQNPGKSLEELTPQFRQAWNRVDARLGQVMYDRLFINNVAKNVMQGTLRAPGWTGGTIAELGGAFPDTYRFFKEWAATGRPPAELPDRVAYTASLLMGTMIANGALTYAFTGQWPKGMDYFAFRDGGKDDNGNETRMVLPTYMKDVLAYAHNFPFGLIHTLGAKTHPVINAIQELLNNKDYYGTEIRHPDDPLYKQGLQMGGYVAHQFVPFWLRGVAQQSQKSDIGVGRKYVAPYFGVMPAAKAITQSAAEGEAADISHAHSAVGGRTAEEAARSQARHQAIRDIAAHVTTATQERRAGHLLPGQEGEARHMARLTPLQRRIFGFGAEDSVRVWNKANESERGEIYRMVHQKIENSKILSRDRKRELLGMIGARPAPVPVQ